MDWADPARRGCDPARATGNQTPSTNAACLTSPSSAGLRGHQAAAGLLLGEAVEARQGSRCGSIRDERVDLFALGSDEGVLAQGHRWRAARPYDPS